MEMEEFISGYCRAADQSRMVTLEIFGDAFQADCGFGSCPYAGECQIASRIRAILEKSLDGVAE